MKHAVFIFGVLIETIHEPGSKFYVECTWIAADSIKQKISNNARENAIS
jgi:hypothetical protein